MRKSIGVKNRRGFAVTRRVTGRLIALAVLAGVLAGCAETELLIHATKQLDRDDTPVTRRDQGDPVPKGYKVGRAYEIAGVWYYPFHDPQYDEAGIASWYGKQFHGLSTANGETFDMNTLTAAHKTLPLPSIARVTNLENGRSLVVRVNDRGPFVNGRVIDLSRRAAQLLGFQRKGTAKVRVEFVEFAPLNAFATADSAYGTKRARRVQVAEVPTVDRVESGGISVEAVEKPIQVDFTMVDSRHDDGGLLSVQAAEIEPTASAGPPIFIQVGAFANEANAARLRGQLQRFGPSQISTVVIDGRTLHRVRIGPLASVQDADETLTLLIHEGFKGSRIYVAR